MDNPSESEMWLDDIITGLQQVRDDPDCWKDLELYAESLTTLVDINDGKERNRDERNMIYLLREIYEVQHKKLSDPDSTVNDLESIAELYQEEFNEIRASDNYKRWMETDEEYNQRCSELVSKMYGKRTTIKTSFDYILFLWMSRYLLSDDY